MRRKSSSEEVPFPAATDWLRNSHSKSNQICPLPPPSATNRYALAIRNIANWPTTVWIYKSIHTAALSAKKASSAKVKACMSKDVSPSKSKSIQLKHYPPNAAAAARRRTMGKAWWCSINLHFWVWMSCRTLLSYKGCWKHDAHLTKWCIWNQRRRPTTAHTHPRS